MSVRVQFTAIRANARIIPGPEVYTALHEYTQGFCAEIIMETSVYPPPVLDTQTGRLAYTRTFKLLGAWRLKDISAGVGIQYVITNAAQDRRGRYYSGYVHGPTGQAGFHVQHGWENIRDHVDRPQFKAGAQATIMGVVR